jgi:four helix bundle protein
MIEEGYKKLEIYNQSHAHAISIHAMTMDLPKFEMYEEGSQIRRSAKSVSSNIVEGYCLRRHKNEFLHYLNRAYASCSETIEHLELLFETKSMTDLNIFEELRNKLGSVSRMIFQFAISVQHDHTTPYYVREEDFPYTIEDYTPDNEK